MKVKAVFAVSIVLTALAAVFYTAYSRENELRKGVNCFAQVRYDYESEDDKAMMNTGILLALSNGNGVVSYSGRFYHRGNTYTVKRYAEVNYTVKNEHAFLLKTQSLRITPVDNLPEPLAKKYLYSYLRDDNGWINLGIQANADNGYVISTTPVPQLLCKQVK